MKRTQFKIAKCLMMLLAIFFTLSVGNVLASSGSTPDDDDLRRTMECDWAITNGVGLADPGYYSEPLDPTTYANDPSDDLVKLAASLDNDPVKMYNWVYKNVYTPQILYDKGNSYYYRYSRLGARGAYLNKIGNHWDQSSLLICLLRISGIPARYAKNDGNDFVYVEAWVNLSNYNGVAGTPKGWVPMIPWIKEANFTAGLDLFKTANPNTDPVPVGLEYDFDDYLSDVKYESALELYERQLQDYLSTNHPGKSLKDASFEQKPIDTTSAILPRSLPKKFVSAAKTSFSEVPNTSREYVRLYINKTDNTNLLDYTLYMPAVAGKKFALDWNISGANLTPVFKLDSEIVQTATLSLLSTDSVALKYQALNRSLVARPSRSAGTYIHMGFDPLSASQTTIEKAKKDLQTVDGSLVLDPATHEEYLGLMGSVIAETFLYRLNENSKRGAKLFHGIQSWGLSPTFIYTKPHSDENPILTNAESKFYYHPQWNIDAQSSGSFYKWDTETDNIIYIDWDAPINKTYRRLYGFGASYDEGKIFEDWMDTPGASTIKGLMLANEDIYGTGNTQLQLVEDDIVEETTPRIATFETLTILPEYSNQVSPYEAYDGFHIMALFRVPDNWTPQADFTFNSGAVDGSYGVQVTTNNAATIYRGTNFTFNSLKISSVVDGAIFNFKGYRGSNTGYSYNQNFTANKLPDTKTFNWTGLNKVVITPVSGSSKGPMVIDNFNYTRSEYIADLDNQTDLHIGWNSVLNIVNYLRDGDTVITPIQVLNHDGLSGNVSIVYKATGDLYSFGMDNGGAASPNVFYDPGSTIASNYTPRPTIAPSTNTAWLADNTITTYSDQYQQVAAQMYTKAASKVGALAVSIADPVDLVTGEFYSEEQPDFMIKARGLDLSVMRKYKSRLIYNGPFGFGWTWNHAENILPLDDNKLIYYDNDRTTFDIGYEDGAYVYPVGSRFTIKKVGGGYELTQNESGVKFSFSDEGYLSKKEDRFGNALTFEYTNGAFPNRITKIKDNLNRDLTLAYNANGKVETVTDFTGRFTHYLYSGDDLVEYRGLDYEAGLANARKFEYLSNQENPFNNHNMSKYILPGGDFLEIGYYKNDQVAYHTNTKGETFNFFFSRLNRYTETWNEEGYYRKAFYNEANDVVRISTENGDLESSEYDKYGHHNKVAQTDANGNRTTFQYYPTGTLEANKEAFVKDRKLYVKTNALGHSWTYEYNDLNNPFSPYRIEDPVGKVVQFEYHTDGSVHKKIQAQGFKFDTNGFLVADAGSLGIVTTFEYDAYGHVTRTTDALGNFETTVYNTDNILPVSKTDKNGNASQFTYYQSGDSMPVGTLKTVTKIVDGNSQTLTYEYNQRNQKTKETDPLNNVTEYQFNEDGKLTKTTLPNGAETRHIYDLARDVVSGGKIIETIDSLSGSEHYTYDALGQLLTKQDKNQNITSYEYDAMGRISKEIDPLGNAVSFEYDGNGNVVSKTDKRGNTSTFVFNAANQLIEENTPCESADTVGGCNIKKEYSYYADGKVEMETIYITDAEDMVTFYEYDALGILFRKTDGYGSSKALVTQYRHDALGRLVRTIQPMGNYQETEYDAKGNQVAVRIYAPDDTLLEESLYVYDARNLLVETTDPMGYKTNIAHDALGRKELVTDSEDNESRYQYDEVGNLVQTMDPLGNITQFFYNLNNQIVRTIDAENGETSFGYDPNGNQLSVVFPDKSETNVFYDALNRKIGEHDELGNQQIFEYDASNLIAQTDARGFITTFEYDAANRMVKTTNALDHSQTVAYDEAGRTLKLTDALGIMTDYEYDVLGNLTKETRASGIDDQSVTRYVYDSNNRKFQEIRELIDQGTPRDLVTEIQYDGRNLVTQIVNGQHLAEPETTNYTYNAKRELIETKDPRGNIVKTVYDSLGRKTSQTRSNGSIVYSWEYDGAGNIIYEKMPEGEEVINSYDGLNQLTLVIKGQDQRFIDYDSRGRIIRDTNFNNDITQYQYDLAGRGVQKTKSVGTTDEAVTSYTYDENGNVLTITNPLNKVVSYEYDGLNQRLKEIDGDSSFQTVTYDANGAVDIVTRQDNTDVQYVRDNLSRRKEVRVDNVLQQLFGYDSLSRMTLAEDYNEGDATHTVTMGYTDLNRVATELQGAYVVGKQYDKNGNKIQITYPSTKVVDKAYDENNLLSTIHNQYSLVATFTPDKNSRMVYAYFSNNMDLALGYDTRGREDYRSYATPTSDPFFSADLGYDPQSNITSRSTSFNGTALSESFAYDHQDRLTTHTRGADPDVTWQYDEVGNWDATNQNGVAEVRTVNDDNEYTAVNSLAPTHDLRGNMTFDGSQTYIYDWANRLVKVKSGAQTLAEYTYDALNRRVTKTVGTSVTTFVYDGSSVIEEYVDGALSHAFVLGDHKDDPILTEYDGQTYYYVKDIQGSIRAITDSTGDLVESYEYTPYGMMRVFDSQGLDITATGSTIGNPFGYTGRRLDAESGLWYYRNRMYSAALGRFLQRDPAGYVDGLNLYAYVLNNPLRYTDPEGLMARAAYDATKNVLNTSVDYWTNKIDNTIEWHNNLGNYYPDAKILSGTGNLGILASLTYGGDVLINSESGELSVFAKGGFEGGLSAFGGSVSAGAIWNLEENSKYEGPSLAATVGTPFDFVSVSGFISSDELLTTKISEDPYYGGTINIGASFMPLPTVAIESSISKEIITIPYLGYLLDPIGMIMNKVDQ